MGYHLVPPQRRTMCGEWDLKVFGMWKVVVGIRRRGTQARIAYADLIPVYPTFVQDV